MVEDAPAGLPELTRYGRQRDHLLDRITALLADDTRVAAAWLSGSFGPGEADEWADFDLHVAVIDEHIAAFLLERPNLYERAGTPVLIQEDMPSDRGSGAPAPRAT